MLLAVTARVVGPTNGASYGAEQLNREAFASCLLDRCGLSESYMCDELTNALETIVNNELVLEGTLTQLDLLCGDWVNSMVELEHKQQQQRPGAQALPRAACSVAVGRHGRDWAAVASSVGSTTKNQCRCKVRSEVTAGRMQELGGKRVRDSWSQVELDALKRAVALHGRDWAAVANSVGSKTKLQCVHKVAKEVAAGRMQEPGGMQCHDLWSKVELGARSKSGTCRP
jgi:hypothetical protein